MITKSFILLFQQHKENIVRSYNAKVTQRP